MIMKLFVDELLSNNYSPTSVYTTLYRVYYYLKYLENEGKTLDQATIVDIRTHIARYANELTRIKTIAAIKRFYRFLYETIDPKYKVIYEKIRVKRPRNYPLPEIPQKNIVKRLIENLNQPYCSILAIAYETGARISEILNLRLRDIEDKEDYIKIVIRNSKSEQRVVYVVEYRNMLLEWLKRHLFKDDPNEYLFYSRLTLKRPLNSSNIHMAIRRAKKKLGITERITPHLLRHLRATELYYKYRLKERELMKIMGWKTRTMIDIYVKLLGDPDLEEKYLATVYGLKLEKHSQETGAYIECPRCHTKTPSTANYCWRCGYPLHQLAALQIDKKRNEIENKLAKLLEELRKHPQILKTLSEIL